jgi:hypothetical protein
VGIYWDDVVHFNTFDVLDCTGLRIENDFMSHVAYHGEGPNEVLADTPQNKNSLVVVISEWL